MTTPIPCQISPRVKYAREKLRMTQDSLAEAVGFKDRQTISDIENGKRAVKTDELLKLSEALNQEMEFFLDPFNVVAEAQYSWRASESLPGSDLDHFQTIANGWVGMLRWLHRQDKGPAPTLGFISLRMSASSTYEQAQSFGERLAEFLNLGLVPARALPECLESKLDIPVLFVDAPSSMPKNAISGAACQIEGFNAILINRRESLFRRNFDLAHELFHVLTWKAMPPSHRESNEVEHRAKAKRIEQLANNFAGALLMPCTSLDHFIDQGRATDVQHLADVAAELQVTTEALGWRLKNLARIDDITRVELARVKRSDHHPVPELFSPAFVKKLHVALDHGRLSARKAAKTLGMPLFELTQLFDAHEMQAPFDL